MSTRAFLLSGKALLCLGILLATTTLASGQTPIQGGFEIRLLAGYSHQPLQGIDSIVGKIVGKGGLEILYDIGPVPKKGLPVLGGSFVNQALRLPEANRLWVKEQTVGGRPFAIAYGKDQRLLVNTAGEKQGVNFSALARTPAEVADILLMVFTIAERKPK